MGYMVFAILVIQLVRLVMDIIEYREIQDRKIRELEWRAKSAKGGRA